MPPELLTAADGGRAAGNACTRKPMAEPSFLRRMLLETLEALLGPDPGNGCRPHCFGIGPPDPGSSCRPMC